MADHILQLLFEQVFPDIVLKSALFESKETIEPDLLQQVAALLKVPG